MTLCPIAIVAGCQKCPAFKVCPLKSVIGDAPKADTTKSTPSKSAARRKKKEKHSETGRARSGTPQRETPNTAGRRSEPG